MTLGGRLVSCEWFGTVGYREAHARQVAHRQRVIDGSATEALWLLEHPATLTTGRRAVPGIDVEQWRRDGVDVVATERGGLATWHGPGQLVGYLIVDAGSRQLGVKTMVGAIEDGLIRWLATQGLSATKQCEHRGVWVGNEKIAAIGLHFRKGVSMHGFALNLCNDLDAYERFTPCGIVGAGVTNVLACTGERTTPEAVAMDVGQAVLDGLMNPG